MREKPGRGGTKAAPLGWTTGYGLFDNVIPESFLGPYGYGSAVTADRIQAMSERGMNLIGFHHPVPAFHEIGTRIVKTNVLILGCPSGFLRHGQLAHLAGAVWTPGSNGIRHNNLLFRSGCSAPERNGLTLSPAPGFVNLHCEARWPGTKPHPRDDTPERQRDTWGFIGTRSEDAADPVHRWSVRMSAGVKCVGMSGGRLLNGSPPPGRSVLKGSG